MISNNRTSNLISTVVPSFIRSDHPRFVEFLEAYYKFMEQETGVLNVSKNMLNYRDIDQSSNTVFEEEFYNTFIKFIPEDISADRTLILKHAKDFYRSRGSEKSIKFLCRILFNKEAKFYYPQVDILKASDGKWFIEKSLKVSDVMVNNVANTSAFSLFVNKTITGSTTNAFAIVESVDTYYDRGQLVQEIKVSSQRRDFDIGENIFTYFEEGGEVKRLTANLFGGIVNSLRIITPGEGYTVGYSIPVISNTGNGAVITVSETTTGSLKALVPARRGAGFKVGDNLLFTGGGGTGASANVLTVDTSGYYHPNSYNIMSSTISLESNTTLSNSVYTNLSSTNANSTIINAASFWSYSNCGPISNVYLISGGNNYTSIPSNDVSSNTIIRSLGILGRLTIEDGGLNYVAGDTIEIINKIGSYGVGALANVTTVDVNGTITKVDFVEMPGHIIGGMGYEQSNLPEANVLTSTGNGANIIVSSILGDGETILSTTYSIGAIRKVSIISGGQGYETAPYLDLTGAGDGTANIEASIITGIYSYPGRYLNDDGFLSSYNFLQDRDYYQKYSYVVRINESINKYKKALMDLVHPAGMKVFGEYLYENEEMTTQLSGTSSIDNSIITII